MSEKISLFSNRILQVPDSPIIPFISGDGTGPDIADGSWHVIKIGGRKIIIKDAIADAFLQQILTRPDEYDVIATFISININQIRKFA